MKKDIHKAKRFDELRRQAEAILGKKTEGTQKGHRDKYHKLLHDLEVHQIELEMQNEELRNGHEKLHVSQGRYVDLYDFAPIGYMTIDQNGQILRGKSDRILVIGRGEALFGEDPFLPFCCQRKPGYVLFASQTDF